MLNDRHVSIDIEACGEVVLSIGAVEFDPRTGLPIERLGGHLAEDACYVVPSIADQLARGLRVDAGALVWLLRQSDATRGTLADNQRPAEESFSKFCAWYARRPLAWCWAYPTSFDLPVIERALRAFEMRPPWRWTNTLDGRTLWRLACANDPTMAHIEAASPASEHHALSDAREQAKWFARYLPAVARAAAPEQETTP